MDSFNLLRRRTTELFNSLPQSLPSLGHRHGHGSSSSMKGTWEKLQIPPLPRSAHSADIVSGTVYIFGGEAAPGRPVDNDMHAITLPSSGAQADYYAIKAKAAKPPAEAAKPPPIPTVIEPEVEGSASTDDEPEATPATEKSEEDSTPTPSDNLLSDVSLTSNPSLDKGKSPATAPTPTVPPPRAGHATAAIGHRIFLFGGRASDSPSLLSEAGLVWVFDTRTALWSSLSPSTPVYPPARSGHAAVATTYPSPDQTNSQNNNQKNESWSAWAINKTTIPEEGTPQAPITGPTALRATDADSDGYGTLIIHGGVLDSGEGAGDLWAFDVRSRTWSQFPDAPRPARSGAALAVGSGRVYRFGGFDGNTQLGGQVDVLEVGVTDEGALGVSPAGWRSIFLGREDVGYKEVDAAIIPGEETGVEGPGERSAAGLEVVTVGGGREYLVLVGGQREGGRFWEDVWAFQVPAQGMSLASVADTAFSVVGRKNGEGSWHRVEMAPHDDEDDESAEGPGPRGWVATAPMGELEENGIVVFGGLGEGNRRLGDGWILRLG